MEITPALNHINILTHDMERLTRFYGDVLGFRPGYRPQSSNTGAWLYLGGNPLIHLVQTSEPFQNKGTAVDHFALNGSGLGDFLARLQSLGVSYRVGISHELDMRQVVAHDPDGNKFEVLFNGSEAEGVDLAPFSGVASEGNS
ncbi:MAG: VOC family protein [Thiolinea sp.]